MIADIHAPAQMLPHELLQRLPPEQPARGLRRDCIQQQAAQRTAQPFMRRKIEAHLFAPQCGGGQAVPHQFAQHDFLGPPADLQVVRQRRREFHDAVIQEGRPDFNGVRHAHAVYLRQDVVGQIPLLIEPQVRVQAVARGRKFAQQTRERSR